MRQLRRLALVLPLAGCADAVVIEWADHRSAYRPSQVGLASTEPTLLETADAGCGDRAALAAAWSPSGGAWPPLGFVAARAEPSRYDYRLHLACSAAGDGATRVRATFLVATTELSTAQGRAPTGAAPGSEAYHRFAQQMLTSLMPRRDPSIDDE